MIHNAHSDCFPGVSTDNHFAPLKQSEYHYQAYQICIYQKDLFTYLLRPSLNGKGNILSQTSHRRSKITIINLLH